jgi:hypothetical protein
MPQDSATVWTEGLLTLEKMVPKVATPAHWRWVFSCMAATSRRGATGFLLQSEVGSLLKRAHASPHLSVEALEAVIRSTEEAELKLELPKWLQAVRPRIGFHRGVFHAKLNARQIAEMLLRLCTSSAHIQFVFDSYATNGEIGSAEWLAFVKAEQTAPLGDQGAVRSLEATLDANNEADVADNRRSVRFDATASKESTTEKGLGVLQFSLQLLASDNDVLEPVPHLEGADHLSNRLCQFWTASSHNTCTQR